MDQDFRTVTSEAKQKDFVTAHAAYSYWETEYGLHQIPIAGVSTSDEPSQKKLKSIVEKSKLRRSHILCWNKILIQK